MQNLNNGDTFGTQRGKINSNFSELDSNKTDQTSVLTKTNTDAFTPSANYHPVTKLYADSLISDWNAVYNPQNLMKDVFARSSHTGPVEPSDVAQDADNRFVTDALIVSWNAKEDGIGAKGTAFNKNFGTGALDVSPGNHAHSKADVGLGQVDNTADIDKPISNATQTALDNKVSTGGVEHFDLDPASGFPTYQEGRIFYDPDHNAVSSYCDVVGVTINFGFEFLIRVWNGTGATIPNGAAVRTDGVDAVTKQANAVLAQADTFSNSIVAGLATHDIPNNTIGYICNHGGVHDFDTSGYTVGASLYLSDTVAGSFTENAPAIRTKIGDVRVSNVLTGTVFVEIQNAIVIPTLFGQLYGKAGTMNLTTANQDINGYTSKSEVSVQGDIATGELTVPNTGKYRLTFAVSMTVPTKASSRSITVRLYDTTGAVEITHSHISIPRDTTGVSRSFSPPVDLILGHAYKMQILADETINGVVFDDVSFDLQSISAV